MIKESPLKFYRDQNKNPDIYEYGKPVEPMTAVFNEEKTEPINLEKQVPEREVITPAGQAYKETIEIIKNGGLKNEYKDNHAEAFIIESRRKIILDFLSKILEDVSNYLSQINYLQIQKAADYDDIKQYQSTIKHSDELRSRFHNKLIQDIKITMRLANVNFNADFSEDARLEEESKMADRQGLSKEEIASLMAQREYFHFPFPVGLFMDFSKVPKDPQGEREYIAHWAFTLYTELTQLESEIHKH